MKVWRRVRKVGQRGAQGRAWWRQKDVAYRAALPPQRHNVRWYDTKVWRRVRKVGQRGAQGRAWWRQKDVAYRAALPPQRHNVRWYDTPIFDKPLVSVRLGTEVVTK